MQRVLGVCGHDSSVKVDERHVYHGKYSLVRVRINYGFM
jgi:hypothetical protein